MMMNDTMLKMHLDATVTERLAEAQQVYEVGRARRLIDLLGALRRVQAELEIAGPARPRFATRAQR